MKKLAIGSVLCLALLSCGGGEGDHSTNDNTTEGAATENPSAIDTTQHPSGMTNSSVISTDTAAMTPPANADPGRRK